MVGHHDPADARLLGQPLDLGHRALDAMGDGHQRDAAVAFRAAAAHLGQEAVVGPRPGEGQLGVGDGSGREPGAEGRRGHARDGVGVGEHDLGGHAVGVELLVALVDVPGAAQALLVVGLPPHDVVVIHLQLLVAVGVALGQVLVELTVVGRVEVGPVALAGQAGMGVGGDDQVAVAHRFAPSTERSS